MLLIVYIVSSPYLLVFSDDRVIVTQEQMMLQVELVRHRVEERQHESFILWFYIYDFFFCKHDLLSVFECVNFELNYEFWFYHF